MSHLETLLERLKAEQRDLTLRAEAHAPVPCGRLLGRIADLECAIRSVEALIEDR